MTPIDLVRAILAAEVDLLYFGGISPHNTPSWLALYWSSRDGLGAQ